jgi:hypothetical protein
MHTKNYSNKRKNNHVAKSDKNKHVAKSDKNSNEIVYNLNFSNIQSAQKIELTVSEISGILNSGKDSKSNFKIYGNFFGDTADDAADDAADDEE